MDVSVCGRWLFHQPPVCFAPCSLFIGVLCTTELSRVLYAKINFIAEGKIDTAGPCSAATYIPGILGIPLLTQDAFLKILEALPQRILIFRAIFGSVEGISGE